MKLHKHLIILLALFTTILSCKKGDTGPQGQPGTANVMYSAWITKEAADWQNLNTPRIYTDITVPALTDSIVNTGTVLVYHFYHNVAKLLPYKYISGENIDFTFTTGSITISVYYDNGISITTINPLQFRYVLIPGGVSGRLSGPVVDYNDYAAVCKYYNIPE